MDTGHPSDYSQSNAQLGVMFEPQVAGPPIYGRRPRLGEAPTSTKQEDKRLLQSGCETR